MDVNLVITDSRYSFASSDFEIKGQELGLGEGGYCKKTTLRGGMQEGVEVVEISNGIVSVRVCPTRGMGLLDGRFRSHRVGWDSPITEIVHPRYIHLLEMGGRGCHYGFNEFMNRCGIEWSGAMGEDVIVDNMGNKNRIFLPLHGKVGWLPASRVVLAAEGGKLTLEGDIQEKIIFGVSYLLRTRIELEKGLPEIRIKDTLYNLAEAEGEYEMLYHTNFGPPFLEKGAKFYGTYDRIVPRNEFAQAGLERFGTMPGPTPGFIEQVFFLLGRPDKSGRSHNLLVNKNGTLAARVSYKTETLPFSAIWVRCAGEREGYVVGFNQVSDLPNPRRIEREEGRLSTIDAGDSHEFEQEISFFEGKGEVEEAVGYIEKNKGNQKKIPCGDFIRFAEKKR